MPFAVEVARPVYRRTEGYGEGMGVDGAVEAAWHQARQASADEVEVVRGKSFVAAIQQDGLPIPVPDRQTEHHDLKWAAKLALFEQQQHVLGSRVPYNGAFRVRAGCAERTYERTIIHVDLPPANPETKVSLAWTHDGTTVDSGAVHAEVAARDALVTANDPCTRWARVPGRPVPVVIDLMLVRGPDDDDGEKMAVPENHGPLPTLKGYHSPLDDPELPARRYLAATQALASYVTWVSANPEVARSLGGHAELDELQQLVDEARRHLGDR